MANHDLTSRIALNLDRHLVLPLLEFLQEKQIHPDVQILKAKDALLSQTNMVDYAMDIYKSLHQTDDVPQEMINRRAEVVRRLKLLEDAAESIITFLQSPNMINEPRPDKQYVLQLLQGYQIGAEQIEALYQYAKFQFECGNYSGAADYLHQYRAICTNPDRILNACWGKLASEILMQNWDEALDELNRLREIIESKNFKNPLTLLQNRIWLMHWSLFIFFNHENGRNGIIDLFLNDRYMNALQTNAPHLLRYLATALIVNKKRRPQLKELIKVIQQEQSAYKDPITEFLYCLYVNYDFDGAQQKLRECENVILNDPFLGKRAEEGNFSTVPLRDEFLENARLFIFEAYCRIHQRIDIATLAEKLNMNFDEAERWIVNLVQNAKLDAKIDSKLGTVVMEPTSLNVYEQIIENTKSLSLRTYKYVNLVLESAAPPVTAAR
ncbi:eukaryotic translation initiation factor 3 subunit E-like [Papaver somniferum]|uniref:eukaryotic translation initiation factor 3 subunit E-like n=1 Tax=Papaver somniferum TaxID=3469 RepID=UPI000E6F879C|nr:eukaryotic translation initiation factor 3 subunit E-like [Papaver somniferum]